MKSIYIHIPFCNKICTYCDFCKIYYNKSLVDKYLIELEKEVFSLYKNEVIKTLYIGGGTPSSLDKDELIKLFSITNRIKLSKNYEFTFECNIENINEDLLILLKNNKVNRISIGIESFNKDILNILGRSYNFSIKEKIDLVKKYFININIDLIYGVNNETIEILDNDLDEFLKLNVPHISIYSLILENNTMLKINNYKEIDDELNNKMYYYIIKKLKDNGYIHYEISNFSKKGYSSKHNLTYWNNEEYYGFGLGSGFYINGIRGSNTRSLSNYLKGNYVLEKEEMKKKINMENEMILGLRKIKGVSKSKFYKKYNVNISDVFDTSKLKENKNYYYIDSKYLFISNYILEDFIDS